jgi:acyl-lipid omega-6 desaturase (Delta-12 desaturase)
MQATHSITPPGVDDPGGAARPARAKAALDASRAYAKAHTARSVWQVVSTVALTLGILFFLAASLEPLVLLLMAPLWSLLMVRVFVLQHDCGHFALFRTRRANDAVGTLLGVLTGVPYLAWRTEHAWHHTHQGKLSHRGVDRVNSPMTVAEALASPEAAQHRSEYVSVGRLAVLGSLSILVLRKKVSGFFQFRPKFRWNVPNRDALIRSVRLTVPAHFALHAGLAWLPGPAAWAAIVIPGYIVGGVIAALLFWVQHNFEHTYHARPDDWDFEAVALQGSGYLKLPAPLTWFTANIGIHHVHHLNPRIPNYRLDEARRAIPGTLAVAPLTWLDLKRSYTHMFWDEEAGVMLDWAGVECRKGK